MRRQSAFKPDMLVAIRQAQESAYFSVASLLRVVEALPASVKYFVSSPSATVGMHVGVQE
jgi:hypothetical protein